jgi:alkaline phosphatase
VTLRNLPCLALLPLFLASPTIADDPFRTMQNDSIRTMRQKIARPYHFGSQGPNSVYSNSTSHSNRQIPAYVFGKKADLSSVAGKNSVYRDQDRLTKLYGSLPPHTLNPQAEYFDQSDLYKVQKDAVDKGAKHVFIVWFDGMDWETTRAAAIAKTGKVYTQGKGSGLVFQDYQANGTAQFGYFVTSPTHDQSERNPDDQTVKINLTTSLPGGYDVRFGGPNPWTPGEFLGQVPGYFQGEKSSKAAREQATKLGGVIHAVTDSAPSAAEFASGVKSFNDGLNVAEDGRDVDTLFIQLQRDKGWKVGTVTSVPFNHASPAAMYAHNVERDDYQDLAREMLGLESIIQKDGKGPRLPGLDVVMGAGFGQVIADSNLKYQGKNAVKDQNLYIADEDLKAIDVKNGGKYVVVTTQLEVRGADSLKKAAETAVRDDKRLFALFGTNTSHLPFQTADGDYRTAAGIRIIRESYTPDDLEENPTLSDMTHAALAVLGAKKDQNFALFVEAGDVDFALHDNNLDNAIGAVLSGDVAVQIIIDWVEKNSNWDDSVLIVTSDHGHYLVIDDAQKLAEAARRR